MDNDYAFYWSCTFGHLEVAKWLYSLDYINIHLFHASVGCFRHLIVVKWLYSLDINIHSNKEYAFCWYCKNGNLEVAQWLYSLGNINIHVNDDNIFNNYPANITNWLNNL